MLARLRMKEIGLIDLEQRGRGVGAFEIAAQADELPALPVNHGGVADSLEEMNAVDDRGQHIIDAGAELRLHQRRVNLMIEAVEALPLLTRNFLAHLAGIFARPVDAKCYRRMVEIVEDQFMSHCLQVAV